MAVIYEVNLWVRAERADAHAAWLHDHVRQILAVPGFVSAEILDVLDPAPDAGWVARSVRYTLADSAALDAYFAERAPAFRADGVARFGDDVRYERRVLSVAARY